MKLFNNTFPVIRALEKGKKFCLTGKILNNIQFNIEPCNFFFFFSLLLIFSSWIYDNQLCFFLYICILFLQGMLSWSTDVQNWRVPDPNPTLCGSLKDYLPHYSDEIRPDSTTALDVHAVNTLKGQKLFPTASKLSSTE